MKRLLKYSIMIILSITIIDFFVGVMCNYFLNKLPNNGDRLVTKPNFALQKAKPDILILGSSRAEHHYDTRILQKRFSKYHIYNAGQHNQGMNYALAVLRSCMMRKKPKIVILDCEPNVLSEVQTYSNSLLKLFYNQNKEVRKVLNKNISDRIVLQSNFYKYNSVIFKLILDSRLPILQDSLMGYEALEGSLDTSLMKYENKKFNSIIDGAISDFKEIIDICKQHNIKLFVVVSPYYYHQNEMSLPYVLLKNMCYNTNTLFFDYMNYSFFDSQPQLFYDINHLNRTGSQIFTYKLFFEISPYL
ncbi:MAG: hypothetical protein ACTTJH_03730 [Bacteroidales bacterium]